MDGRSGYNKYNTVGPLKLVTYATCHCAIRVCCVLPASDTLGASLPFFSLLFFLWFSSSGAHKRVIHSIYQFSQLMGYPTSPILGTLCGLQIPKWVEESSTVDIIISTVSCGAVRLRFGSVSYLGLGHKMICENR